MIRRIITIDEEKCNGCGLCAKVCHEGAIGMVGGKAKLLREDYCDGLGDCLPACLVNAISFEEREAPAYNEAAVLAAKEVSSGPAPWGCAGSCEAAKIVSSELNNFPIQIKLMPENSPCLDDAHLLIAADCTAYAYGNFHEELMKNRITLIGCPKLDSINYAEKLTRIFRDRDVRSVTVARMTVPCCGGLYYAVQSAMENSGKDIPVTIVTISPDGRILEYQ